MNYVIEVNITGKDNICFTRHTAEGGNPKRQRISKGVHANIRMTAMGDDFTGEWYMARHILAFETDVKEYSFPHQGNLEAGPAGNPSGSRSSTRPLLTRGSLKVTSADRPLALEPLWKACPGPGMILASLSTYSLQAEEAKHLSLSKTPVGRAALGAEGCGACGVRVRLRAAFAYVTPVVRLNNAFRSEQQKCCIND